MNKKTYTLILTLALFVSCSGLQSYYYKLEKYMINENYDRAQSLIDVSKKYYGTKNEFLYYLDLAFTQHLSQNYQQSNDNFETAKKIYDANYTKSISAGAFSLFANDNVIPYYGHTYEMAYINVFCALNYILQGLDNEALVEARQADNLFKKINADSYGKAFYNDDPFVRYFMGMVYENAGYYNDAIISYKLALRNYDKSLYSKTNYKQPKGNIGYNLPVPKDLIYSLYNLYVKFGFSQEAEKLKTIFPFFVSENNEDNCGELIIVNYNGLSPKKVDNIMEISFYKAWPYFVSTKVSTQEQDQAEKVKSTVRAGFSDDYIKIAFAKYERYQNKITSFEVENTSIPNKNSSEQDILSNSYIVSDIGTLLISALQKENLATYSKTIARAVGRYVIAKTVTDQIRQQESKDNNTLSILTNSFLNITNSLLEKADKRSWRTLPETINMAKIYLPEGEHTLNIKYLSSTKTTVYSEKIKVDIKRNKKTFVITKSFKNY